MATKFTIDDGRFYTAVDNLVEKTGLEAKEVLRLTGRHLVETLIKLTPPHSGRVGKAFSEGSKSQRDMGRKSVDFDVSRVVGVLKELNLYKDPKIRKLINKKDFKALSRIIGRPVVNNVPSNFHDRYRNRRGRVNKSTGKQIFVVNKGAKNSYVTKVANKIGTYKSGWNKAARLLGARANHGWYKWAQKQTGRGMIRDRSSKINWPKQEIVFANLVDYATSSSQTNRWLRYAQGISMGKMKRFYEHMVKRRMEKEMGKPRGSLG